jgi:hypothetical protein
MALIEFFRELKVSFCQVGVSIWEPRCGVKKCKLIVHDTLVRSLQIIERLFATFLSKICRNQNVLVSTMDYF